MNQRSIALFSALILHARGNTSIPVEVPKHELSVLRVIHGNNLQVNGPIDDQGEVPESAADELQRLQAKYRQPNERDPVRIAFPNGPEDLERYGFDINGEAVQAPQSSVVRHDKASDAATNLGDAESLAAFEAANQQARALADREAELQAREAVLAEREAAAAAEAAEREAAAAAAAEAAAREAAAKGTEKGAAKK